MPSLRKSLKRPETYLALLVLLAGLAVLDSYRPPSHQVSAKLYVGVVRAYQHFGRPLLEGHVRCRFRPTCSEYSLAAVQEFGIRRGLALTIHRINSCTTKVPMGTLDPILPAN